MESRRRFLKSAYCLPSAAALFVETAASGSGNPDYAESLAGYNVKCSPDFDTDEMRVIGQTTKKLASHTGDNFVSGLGLLLEKMKPDPQVAGRYAGHALKRGIGPYGFAAVSEITPETPYSPPYAIKLVPKKVMDAAYSSYDPFVTSVSLSELQVLDTFLGFGKELSRLEDASGGPLPTDGLHHPFAIKFVERLNRMREEFVSSRGIGIHPYVCMMRHLHEISARDGFGAVGLYALWGDTLTTKGLGKGFEEAVGTVKSLFRSIKRRKRPY